jgi:hypothetical protein
MILVKQVELEVIGADLAERLEVGIDPASR